MLITLAIASALVQPSASLSLPPVHCQVPCGIYGDHLRLELLLEHAATIEKAMAQIESLGAVDRPNWNQLVRWVSTKEEHAQTVQDQVAEYWLAQRIKMPEGEQGSPDFVRDMRLYMTDLVFAHQIITSAMACKQTTDAANVTALREAVRGLRLSRIGPEEEAHLAEGHGDHGDGRLDMEAQVKPELVKARIGVAKASLRVLDDAVTEFTLHNNRLPENLEMLVFKDSNGAAYLSMDEVPKDPWGTEYVYELSEDDSWGYRLLSYGSDGKPGGTGEAADIILGEGDDK